MAEATARAPGKLILFGEHAVVYGQPALAVPLTSLQATATVRSSTAGHGIVIEAEDLGLRVALAKAAETGLAKTVELVLARFRMPEPDAVISVHSTIPVASGLGSGAAVSAALAQALATYLGQRLGAATLSALVFEVEKVHHGTPSGIDNTVICYSKPVFFVRDLEPETFRPAAPFDLVVADTGVASPTRVSVGAVREGWERDPQTYEAIFKEIGSITRSARTAIESGDVTALGPLMNRNHSLLQRLDVSSPELDRLVGAALAAGALGAKLSGGGRGGNMIALSTRDSVPHITTALETAGAVRVMHTVVS